MPTQHAEAKKYTVIRAEQIGLSLTQYDRNHRITVHSDYFDGGIYTGTIYECKAYMQGATQYIAAEAVGARAENRVLAARMAYHLSEIAYTAYKLQWPTKREGYAPVRDDLTEALRSAYDDARAVITTLEAMAPTMPTPDEVSINHKRAVMAEIVRELTAATQKAVEMMKGL